MPINDITTLLSDLDSIDTQEDDVVKALLQRGIELEEARRRSLSVTVGDLRSLRDALGQLGTAIDAVQATAVRAEATAAAARPHRPRPGSRADSRARESASPEPVPTPAPSPTATPAAVVPPAAAPAPPPPATARADVRRARRTGARARRCSGTHACAHARAHA